MSRSYTVVAPPRKPLSGAGGASRRKCGNPRGLIWKVSTLRVFQGGFVHICSIFFHYFSMFTITGSGYIGSNNTDHIHLLRSSYFGNKRRGRQFGAKKNDNSMAGIFV